ncbi:MAG TPA: sugar transferase [Planctomycetaceae bacterium]|nr:sugar transferase [Planctomycetaceae bacterium]
MAKRLFDLCASIIALALLWPILLLAYLAIRLSSPGPAMYPAKRVGRHGRIFVMHKFRTMHIGADAGSAITGARDPRVFFAGRILRALKIDELPQLYDVLTGKMSIVGPRPEDPRIVAQYYSAEALRTLDVAPGLSSLGSIYYYTHTQDHLDDSDPEGSYLANLLPIKLALDIIHQRRASMTYDMKIILKTAVTILLIGLGKRQFADPPELAEARQLMLNTAPLVLTVRK